MARNKAKTRKIGGHTKEQMKIALELIKKGYKIRKAAKEVGLPFATVRRYNEKLKAPNMTIETIRLVPHYDINRVFSLAQEDALKKYFTHCALLFYGLSTEQCREVAYQMAKINNINVPKSWDEQKKAGIDWLKSFRKRHAELSLRKPEPCSLARATAFNQTNVKTFFDNLDNVMKRDPKLSNGTRIFNLDETSTTTVQKPLKVLGPKGHKNLGKVTSGEKGTLVTTCCIISASGQALPPVLVFPRKNFKPHMIKGTPPGSLGLAASTGWMNSELFIAVMQHFIKHSSSSQENPSILIMDNHESHLSIEALDLAKSSGVTVITLHPHTSAKLQPLDVGVFAPFKTFYNCAIDSWMLNHAGQPVTIYDIGELVGTAFLKSMTPINITQAFKKTGIFPFDRNVFTELDFLPSSVTDRPCPKYGELDSQEVTVGNGMEDQNPKCSTTKPKETSNEHEPLEASNEITDNAEVPSNSKDSTFISPFQFRDPVKAGPRKNKQRKRKLGRSLIATDTPEKAEMEMNRAAAKIRKSSQGKKHVKKCFESDSEEDQEEVILESEEEDWMEEKENDKPVLTQEDLEVSLTRQPEKGEFVIVFFPTKKQKVYYIGKILETRNQDLEYFISFLRRKSQSQEYFHFPDVPDLCYVNESDIKLIFPKPIESGSTARQQSYFSFLFDFSQLNVR